MKMKKMRVAVIAGLALATGCVAGAEPPNVLFFALDDMNDWVGFLGGCWIGVWWVIRLRVTLA